MTIPLDELAKDITSDGLIDADELAKIRERIYADGIVDREEADILFSINDAVSGNENDPGWKEFFVEAITKHVLGDERSPNAVDADESKWLINKISADNRIDEVELALLVNIMTKAKRTTEELQQFVLASLKASILADGIIDAGEVEIIKKVIYGVGSGSGEKIDRAEADFLFELNDAVSGKNNDPGWEALFVEAISKHLLDDETSPNIIDEDEASWLIQKVQADGNIDPCEKALLTNLKKRAISFHDSLTPFFKQI